MALKKYFKIILLLLLIVLIIIAGYNFRDELQLDKLQSLVQSFGILAPVIFILLYILATILFLPGAALTLAGGLIFGAYWGTLYNLLGATIGATCSFLIARYIASEWVQNRSKGMLQRLRDGIDNEGWKFVAIVRLVPLFPFNVLNYALGLTNIRLIEYILASFIFMAPAGFAYTYLGSLGQTAIAGETGKLITRAFIAIGLLVLVAAIPWFISKVRKEKIN